MPISAQHPTFIPLRAFSHRGPSVAGGSRALALHACACTLIALLFHLTSRWARLSSYRGTLLCQVTIYIFYIYFIIYIFYIYFIIYIFLAKPLTHLTKLGVKFHWEKSQQEAFENLCDIIITEPILQYPNFSKPFIVTTDASDYAIGAILSPAEIGQDLPVSYASRTLNDAETKYATIEKELLAVLFGVQNFRPYLYGRKFTLVTDHRPLVWLHNIKNPGSKLNRWRLRLGE